MNSATFGKLFQVTLDGVVDAQPLYVSGVAIPNQGTHNVLIVATENDSLYALDADTGAQLWKTVAASPRAKRLPTTRGASGDSQIGITSTPVIYLKPGTTEGAIFAVAMSKDSSGKYHQRLHKVNLTTGTRLRLGVEMTGSIRGPGEQQRRQRYFRSQTV